MSGWQVWMADLFALAGLAVSTLAVLGVRRLPDVYMKLHAAGKVASLGVAAFAISAAFAAGMETAVRAALAALFVLLTTALTSHAIARAAADRGERLRGPGAFDESPRRLDRPRDG